MYGETITTLPKGYAPLQQWPEYDLLHLPLQSFNPEIVGHNPRGVRWGVWPLMFEEYVSDEEPDMTLSDPAYQARNRVVMWRTLTRADQPKGWYRLGRRPAKLEGFAELIDDSYSQRWDESAKRYRNKWLREYNEQTHRIEKIEYSAYKAAYTRSPIAKSVKNSLSNLIERQLNEATRQFFEFSAIKNIESGDIVASMCIFNSPTMNASYYVSGFYVPAESRVPAMVALMDHWFKTSQDRGFRFLLFGEFWMPGKPKDWEGFSRFKAKFGLHYIAYPPVLMRVVRGKLF